MSPLRFLYVCALMTLFIHQAHAQSASQSIIDAQVWLDRANASPGPIDGLMGKNTRTAIEAFQRMQGLQETGEFDEQTRAALQSRSDEPTMRDYEISKDDVNGPFLREIPAQMQEMAKLDRLSYTSALELFSEKFHMDPDLLRSLNQGKRFDQAGVTIRVANVEDGQKLQTDVARIEVDKDAQTVRAYDDAGNLVAAYPATVGSDETPSPEGEHKVVAIAENPTYTYDPEKLNFKGVESKKQFTIPPGPNNPVGLVWIDLNAPGYGIHGSPDPTQIRRQSSHGCVRLTNWDALQLAHAVSKGVTVAFVSGQQTTGQDSGAQKQ